MNIIHIYKDYEPVLGGIENHIRVLAEAQAASGHCVTVLAAARGPHTEERTLNGVRLILTGRLGTAASTPLSPALFARAARLHADVVHLHFPHPPGEIANLIFHPAPHTVITYHSDIIRQQGILRFYRPIMRHVLRAADRILPTSPMYIESSPNLRPLRERCTVVPLGVNLERFRPPTPAERESARQRFALPGDRPVILFVGRLRYYKGLDDLLRALAKVPDASLLLVGSGPMEPMLHQWVDELGLGERVTFAGEVPDDELAACYHAGDLFVLPANSRAEAFGTVLVEAMASGLPVISTELGTGTSWVNQTGSTGLVVAPHAPNELAAAISELLSDSNRLARYAEAARRRVEQQFGEARMIQRVEEIYFQVTGR
jgi:glycosyltransferase involved in cell wall biosynthesis